MTYANLTDIKRRKPFKWWHERIIDDMLAFPHDKLADRSKRLGYTVSTLSIIINSDMFQAVYQSRRAALTESMNDAISGKLAQAANDSLDILLETMHKKRDSLGFSQLADFTHKSLDKLGYGAKAPAGVSVNINQKNVHIQPAVTPEQLEEARKALRAAEGQRALAAPVKQIEANPIAETEYVEIEASVDPEDS